MNPYFDEKASQVEPSELVAFGVEIISRYGKADELIEMLSFVQMAAHQDVSHILKKVFYDSKACLCCFEFTEKIYLGDSIERKLFAVAKETINQFDWFGTVYHRGEDPY